MPTISPLSLVKNDNVDERAPTVAEARAAVRAAARAAERCADDWAAAEGHVAFRDVEAELHELVLAFARALVVLFLCLRERAVMATWPDGECVEAWGRSFRRAPAIARNLTTIFGVVRYWRTYMREVSGVDKQGFHPLDLSLGLPADRFSWTVLAKASWLATKLSFAEAKATMAAFMPNVPSTEVIERAVLGFGRFAEKWLQERPAPEDDGEVLVIMFDGKGIPTATDAELARRRGRRKKKKPEASPRHRGRRKRKRSPKKPRRKKGDHSKNAKMATTVVMYTLSRRGTRRLEGPINKWIYASFAPKWWAFYIARKWADRRGFTKDSGRLVQVVTDGDNDLADLCSAYFPEAEHTIDIWHVVERLWSAGECFLPEGSQALTRWVEEQKDRLFDGEIEDILDEMRTRLAAIAKTGPGNKGRRERLGKAIAYIDKRADKLDYGSLRRRDLEISTGPIEGAIKHVIGKRQDHGGMRWIKERAEAVLKLRCIEVTGGWDAFERELHDRRHRAGLVLKQRLRLQANRPAGLPHMLEAA